MVATQDVNYIMHVCECTKEAAEAQTWLATSSTGIALVAADIELVLQSRTLLRNVRNCHFF